MGTRHHSTGGLYDRIASPAYCCHCAPPDEPVKLGGAVGSEALGMPASYDEFKGTVAAVRTAPFCDTRINEVRAKKGQVMNFKGDPDHPYAKLRDEATAHRVRESKKDFRSRGGKGHKLGPAAKGRLIRRGMDAIIYTPEELAYLKNNISERGFHYDGSPKFFGRAGEAFAEAMSKLMEGK